MSEEKYLKLAKVLDMLPSGFPPTESGIEIKILKKIFRPEDIDLFCDLKLDFETAEEIAQRTGRELEGLEEHLLEMHERGQFFAVNIGGIYVFRMVPFVLGIYEYQHPHLDRELAEMCEEYMKVFSKQFFSFCIQLNSFCKEHKILIPKLHIARCKYLVFILRIGNGFDNNIPC